MRRDGGRIWRRFEGSNKRQICHRGIEAQRKQRGNEVVFWVVAFLLISDERDILKVGQGGRTLRRFMVKAKAVLPVQEVTIGRSLEIGQVGVEVGD